jgi:hypothetical protein
MRRPFVLTLGALLLAGTARAESPCPPSYGRVRELPAVLFRAQSETPQRSLIADPNSLAGWVEVEFDGQGLRYLNRLPALALPWELVRVEMSWLDRAGQPAATPGVLPDADHCGVAALFPGQETRTLELPPFPEGADRGEFRLHVRSWSIGF